MHVLGLEQVGRRPRSWSAGTLNVPPIRVALLSAVAVGALFLVAASTGSAEAAQRNGLIAFSVVRGCNEERSLCNYFVNTIGPNGHGRRALACSRGRARDCRDAVPRFSPNGRVLATATDPSNFGDFLTLRRPGGRLLRTIKGVGGISDFAWGPRGRGLAINEGGRIALLDLRGRRKRRTVRQRTGFDVAWSRQGRLAWSAPSTGDILVTDSTQRRTRRLRIRGPIAARWPRWSPDGRRLVFEDISVNGGGAYSIRPDGSGLKLVGVSCGPPIGANTHASVVWSPDGREIACATGGNELVAYNVKTGRERIIARAAYAHSIDWQPLGR